MNDFRQLYYLKFSPSSSDFVLAPQPNNSKGYYAIKRTKISEDQANDFTDYLAERYGDELNLIYLEYEFDCFFHICKECGKVETKKEHNKAYGLYCKECHFAHKKEEYAENRIKVEQAERLERLREYIKTDQGKIEVCTPSVIQANIYVQLKKRYMYWKDIAGCIGMQQSNLDRMFKQNKSIDVAIIYKICEFLKVPFDILVRVPKGANLKKKRGVPLHVIEKNLRK